MSTIFEYYSYPLPLKDLMAAIEKTNPVSSLEIETFREAFTEMESNLVLSRNVIPQTEGKSDFISPLESAVTSATKVEPYVNLTLSEESALVSAESDVVSSLCEESSHTPTAEIETDSFSPESKELAIMPTIKPQSDVTSLLEKEPALIMEAEVDPAVILPIIKETFSAPSIKDQVDSSSAEEESTQNIETLIECNPVSSSSPNNKKKRFRAIRKFCSRLCCIHRVKDS